jgi:hypothetical protein
MNIMEYGHLDNQPLTFGKYKGQTPTQLSTSHPSYIVWMFKTFESQPCSRKLYWDCLDSMSSVSKSTLPCIGGAGDGYDHDDYERGFEYY